MKVMMKVIKIVIKNDMFISTLNYNDLDKLIYIYIIILNIKYVLIILNINFIKYMNKIKK